MALDKKKSINNILDEKRIFPPSKEFSENSNISSQEELQNLKNKQQIIQFNFGNRLQNLNWIGLSHFKLY